jgi:ADP-heptose:LPS heptosyltransferase
LLPSTSCNELAGELLQRCLAGEAPPLDELVDRDCSDAIFRIVVEGLADRFEPPLCDTYADLFSPVIERLMPDLRGLRDRYERIRQPRVCKQNPDKVVVLSRVTLGADIAITSVILDAAKKRFPKAEIYLAGSKKSTDLFAGDPRIHHLPVTYPRHGTLRERLSTRTTFPGIVIDPDSRLTQLGLLPVCEEQNYYFFESRAYGKATEANLTELTRQWAEQTLEVPAHPYIDVGQALPPVHRTAVSLGVGGNHSKRLSQSQEATLLKLLSDQAPVLIDRGAGGEEASRVDRAIAQSRARNITTWNGSFAGFCALIRASIAYVGYDSAGQHAAAAFNLPQLTIFKGAVCERMFHRWRPASKRARILKNFEPQKLLRILPKIL